MNNAVEIEHHKRAEDELSDIVIALLKGVIYQNKDPIRWNNLLNHQASVRDYLKVMYLQLHIDESEGYAFLKTQTAEDDAVNIPRLMARRQLSFPVSLLLALLRKKLAEFDASGSETRLVLDRNELVELIRVFLPDTSNEAKLIDQIDRHINKVVEIGFLRPLNQKSLAGCATYEVRRIIKSFVDAQWLADFDAKLQQYQEKLEDE